MYSENRAKLAHLLRARCEVDACQADRSNNNVVI